MLLSQVRGSFCTFVRIQPLLVCKKSVALCMLEGMDAANAEVCA